MAKRKLSSSYVRKREGIKTAVVQRSLEKIRIAAGGSGFRTSGQLKTGSKITYGSPTGSKVKTLRNGEQKTVSKLKGKNPNTTKGPGQRALNVKAKKKPTVARIVLTPGKKTNPYAGRAKPVLRKRNK